MNLRQLPMLALLMMPALFGVGIMLFSQAAPATVQVSPAPVAGCWHRVAPGESLRRLAWRYYGSSRLWRPLQIANDVDMQPVAGSRLWIPPLQPGPEAGAPGW